MSDPLTIVVGFTVGATAVLVGNLVGFHLRKKWSNERRSHLCDYCWGIDVSDCPRKRESPGLEPDDV